MEDIKTEVTHESSESIVGGQCIGSNGLFWLRHSIQPGSDREWDHTVYQSSNEFKGGNRAPGNDRAGPRGEFALHAL